MFNSCFSTNEKFIGGATFDLNSNAILSKVIIAFTAKKLLQDIWSTGARGIETRKEIYTAVKEFIRKGEKLICRGSRSR